MKRLKWAPVMSNTLERWRVFFISDYCDFQHHYVALLLSARVMCSSSVLERNRPQVSRSTQDIVFIAIIARKAFLSERDVHVGDKKNRRISLGGFV